MKLQDIVRLRLYNQLVSHQPFQTPEKVVHWMGAMQAQDYLASLWAIGLRISPSITVTEPTVEEAIANRKIVRTWPMRGTLHYVTADDVRWMLRLLTPRVMRSSAGRYRELELDDKVFAKSRKLLEQALLNGKQLTRQEVYGVLEQAGISTHSQRGIHILGHLAQDALICIGPKKEKQHTFTLLDEWIPNSKELPCEAALANLASRYFTSHGPATAYDFATWSGLTLADARKGMDLVKGDFQLADVEGQTYWFPEPKNELFVRENSENVWLLPAFDEMLCGYKDRSAILDAGYKKTAILKNGIICPIMIVSTKAAGTWKRILKKDKFTFEPNYFQSPTKSTEKAVAEQVKSLGKFIGKSHS